MKINNYYYSVKKRSLDLLLSFLLLIPVIPLIIILSLIILLQSGPPTFFIQKRTGQNKKNFKIVKLRTMKANASKLKKKYQHLNQAPKPMFKIFNDPRFTQFGKFLSKTGLDELPQLINVILGDMSLIGPRPLPTDEAKKIPKDWQWRFQVKPGLFSEWTLSLKRHESLAKWKKLEEKTLREGGLIFDLKIILRTLFRRAPLFLKLLLSSSKFLK